jgi:hypothetical protein
MEESTTYRAILSRGERKGRIEGSIEEAREILLLLAKGMLGKPDAATLAALHSIPSQGRLRELIKRVERVATWEDLFALA